MIGRQARRRGRLGVALALAVLLGASPSVADEGLTKRIEAALRKGGLRGARVGILVVDLETGQTLYERDAEVPLKPASVTKLATSATALARLRPEYRFRTALRGRGKTLGSTFQGDIYLQSQGDPMLVDERIWLLVDALRARGVRSVTGKLYVDDGFFDRERFGEGWGPRSRSAYNAPHGAVSVNFNTLRTRGRPIAIAGDPGEHAGQVVLKRLADAGIQVQGGFGGARAVEESVTLLAETRSGPLTEIVASLNKISNNFIAEQLLKTLGASEHEPPGTAPKGIEVVAAHLRQLGIQAGQFELYDGSGLSHLNRLSARAVVTLIRETLLDFEAGPEFLASLKVAGVDGSPGRFRDPLCQRRMRVKTGHLQGVASLAGVAETVGGRRLVFAVLANDYRRGRFAADRGIEDVCEAFLGFDSSAPLGNARVQRRKSEPVATSLPPVLGPDAADLEQDPEDDAGD